ncbi:hypothetical protein G6F43_014321 [Rhizopus delemar]|nr:hypothetical protein G6F43_014321 [Rhizopus delemar]
MEYFDKEFPTNLDHEDYPSWAFSSPGLGFSAEVSGSSSSAAANPMHKIYSSYKNYCNDLQFSVDKLASAL